MTDDEIIAVVQAHKDGERIEWVGRCEANRDINWRYDANPKWNFEHLIYRVKPEPREWWLERSKTCDGYYVLGKDKCRMGFLAEPLIHVREVIE